MKPTEMIELVSQAMRDAAKENANFFLIVPVVVSEILLEPNI